MNTFPFLPVSHRNFMDKAIPILKKDARILGVAVGGSWITQSMDEYSDIDLVIIIKDSNIAEVMGERMAIAESLGKLLSGFTGEHVGEPRLLICLYDKPLLHVDLKFTGLADFAKRIEDPFVVWERNAELSLTIKNNPGTHPMPNLQWIEDRFWVWIHYEAAKLAGVNCWRLWMDWPSCATWFWAPFAMSSTASSPGVSVASNPSHLIPWATSKRPCLHMTECLAEMPLNPP